MKSSIGFLAAMRAEIDACLDDAEKVSDLINMRDWDEVCPGELQHYWSKIVCKLEELREKFEEDRC